MPVFNVVRAPRSCIPSSDRQPCPLSTDTPPDSLNLQMILCSVDGGSQFYIQEHFSEIAPSFFITVCHRLVNLCPSLHQRLCLTEFLPLYQIMLLTCCQLTLLVVKCSSICFQYVNLCQLLFQPFVARVTTFLRCVAAIKVKVSQCFL